MCNLADLQDGKTKVKFMLRIYYIRIRNQLKSRIRIRTRIRKKSLWIHNTVCNCVCVPMELVFSVYFNEDLYELYAALNILVFISFKINEPGQTYLSSNNGHGWKGVVSPGPGYRDICIMLEVSTVAVNNNIRYIPPVYSWQHRVLNYPEDQAFSPSYDSAPSSSSPPRSRQ